MKRLLFKALPGLFLLALLLAGCARSAAAPAAASANPWPTHAPGATPYVHTMSETAPAPVPQEGEVFETMEDRGTLFVDTRGSLCLPACPNLLITSVSEAMQALGRVERGESSASSMVFCDVVGLLEDLGDEGSQLFARCITGAGRSACPTFLLAAEHWQVCNRYDEWFRVVCGQGTGVWVGPGFAEQTVFPLSRVLPAYRAPLPANDGFLVSRGAVRAVRFVQPGEAMPS